MLVYVGFFILTFTSGVFGSQKPPPCNSEPSCPKNEHYTRNNPRCIRTCANKFVPISDDCKPFTGCVCNGDLVRPNDDASGPCITQDKCPCRDDPKNPEHKVTAYSDASAFAEFTQEKKISDGKSIAHSSAQASSFASSSSSYTSIISSDCGGKKCSDPNEVYRECPSACPLTCAEPNPRPCTKNCGKDHCECVPGFVRNEITGRCVRPKDCPGKRCSDPNAVYKTCPSECPLTCAHPNPRPCIERCAKEGCECASGFVLNEATGRCVRPADCPGKKCSDPNEVYRECPSACPLTCTEPNPRPCTKNCGKEHCECVPGFVRNEITGRCVRPKDCPGKRCSDPNAVYKTCPSACPLTCAQPNPRPCIAVCGKEGCECVPGFVLNEATGRCVRPKDCPGKKCKDPNAVYKECPNPCPLTCDDPFPKPCNKMCIKYGCECAPGFIMNCNDIDAKCVRPDDCPDPIPCPMHSHYVINDNQCPKTCGNRLLPTSDVAGACAPFTGCVCNRGFVRKYDNATGPCIPENKCPPIPCQCGVNEVPTSCRIICPPQTCTSIFSKYACFHTECEPGCDCRDGYLRDSKGVCIPSEDCFKPDPIVCGPNEVATDCAIECPPQSCESIYTTYLCAETECTPGCNCIDGYLRNNDGICIPSEECFSDPSECGGDLNATRVEGCTSACPPTCAKADPDVCSKICVLNACECKLGYIRSCEDGVCIDPKDCPGGSPKCRANQTYVDCKSECPINYCPVDDSRGLIACSAPNPCQGGCVCIGGHLRVSNEDLRCILASDCPEVECTRPNEVWDRNPSPCFLERCDDRGKECNYPYPPGPRCVCEKGFYRNESDACIPESECPKLGCNGDMNATFSNTASKCPATCSEPDSDQICDNCTEPGCVCNEGFIKSELDGPCIRPYDCEGGSPHCCGNMTYVTCKIDCEMKYCPENENEIFIICDPVWPCPPGCECKPGYLMPNKADRTCILAADCPPRECTRPNEVWDSSPSICNYEKCDEMYYTCGDPKPGRPKCGCKEGYYKDNNGVCIPAEECPCQIPDECQRTCAEPNPLNCAYNPPKFNMNGCDCKEGYVLSEKGGDCIPIEECPPQIACHGDPNAIPKRCPKACPSTCTSPNQVYCKKKCEPIACVCKSGFILSDETGQCILPDECPGGNPCGKSGRFVDCKTDCSGDYCPVNDSRDIVLCDPPKPEDCLSGCICNFNHKRKSRKDPRCIVSSDCRPVNCTRPNEKWSGCPSACLAENCEDIPNQPSVCYTLVLNCDPRCICKKNHFRNSSGICIPAEDCQEEVKREGERDGDPNAVNCNCPNTCKSTCTSPEFQICTAQCMPRGCVCKQASGCGGDANAMYSNCPSACQPTCTKPKPEICTDQCLEPGCICKPEFVRNEEDGKCIKLEECPDKPGCNGDMNATYSDHTSKYPATCSKPDADDTECEEPGCVCNEGFIRSEPGGPCISPSDCEGGSPTCEGNKTYVFCKVGCPTNYCPVDDSLAIIACDPMQPCQGGCACKEGYLMISEEDDKCILSSECPEVECTRPNEVWDPYAPGCLHERCYDKDIPCDFEYSGPPRCRCIEGYYRDQDDICVPEDECPQEGCNGDMNATLSNDPSKCPATCSEPDSDRECDTECEKPGCECNEGFIRSELDGPCIRPYDCDGGAPHCCGNMTYVTCKIDCYMKYCPEDENEIFRICDPVWPCPSGCECKLGYLMLNKAERTCILAADCPAVECTRPNEVWDGSPSNCNYEKCSDMYKTCYDPNPGRPKCVCKDGYYRDDDGVCIPAEECPKPKCGYNEVEVPCRQICPPQNCEIAYTDYACTKESEICEPGCNCLPDHLRNGSGICIPNDQCPYPSTPVCGINEIARDCRRICPPQTCLSKYALFRCAEGLPCEPGCDCVPNYLRDDRGICIPSEQCPAPPSTPVCGTNEIARDCRRICPPQTCLSKYALFKCVADLPCEPGCDCVPNYLRDDRGICIPSEQCPAPCEVPDECKRTCAKPNPPDCTYDPPEVNMNGCNCKEGYILKELGGDCIPIEQCSPDVACHGDYNARPKRCPKACPSTCKSPNQVNCKKMCEPIACQCKPGFILSDRTGQCILPDKCPGGNPCGMGGIFVNCTTPDCPRDYCPVNDSRDIVLCEPPKPEDCLSGCICKLNHKKKSRKDPRCIMASACPPVKCTRPNEIWCDCPSACLAENCEDVNNQPTTCNTLVQNYCEPRCICIKNHFRNSKGICIPAEDCPC